MISYSEQIAQLKKERDNALAQCGETFAKLSDVSIGASRKVLAMTVELKECKQNMSDNNEYYSGLIASAKDEVLELGNKLMLANAEIAELKQQVKTQGYN